MEYLIIALLISFFIYNLVSFKFIGSILEKRKTSDILVIPMSIINSFVVFNMIKVNEYIPIHVFGGIGLLILLNTYIVYKDTLLRNYFITASFLIHIMGVFSICVSLFAVLTNQTMYQVANSINIIFCMISTACLLQLCLVVVIKFIPAKNIKIINQHGEQLIFMVIMLTLFNLYLMLNSKVYTIENYNVLYLENQIIVPAVMLSMAYMCLFYSIKMGNLLGYKEKTDKLKDAYEKEKLYRDVIDKDVLIVCDVNFSKNNIITGLETLRGNVGNRIYIYNEMVNYISQNFVEKNFKSNFVDLFNLENIFKEFENGTKEIHFEFKAKINTKDYIWVHMHLPIIRNEKGDICGFIQLRDIDYKMKEQLELKRKSELDLLTSLYNKVTTADRINEFLKRDNRKSRGALFIIDIDNFKTINDRLGHFKGDEVLLELSKSLSSIFRPYDIIGRIGGDEFIVFIEGEFNENYIKQKALKICELFNRSYSNDNIEFYWVSASIGISLYPNFGESFEELYKTADIALYQTKSKGKNGYTIYEYNFKQLEYISERTKIEQIKNAND
ncbi:MAG: GGDEF domain-containing protein [Peptostreptococcaceae bacterium]